MDEWLLLGQLFEAAQARSRTRARRLADLLFTFAVDGAIRNIAQTFMEGRTTGWQAYASDLGFPAAIARETMTAWTVQAREQSATLVSQLVETLGDRPEVTRVFIDNYATNVTNNTLWAGIDASGDELAVLAETEWKTWVRSWPRREERDWHSTLEGVTIPVDDAFTLPGGPNVGAQVYGPRDWDAVDDPGEHMNCGHALRFSVSASEDMLGRTLSLGRTVYEPPAP